MTLWHAMLFLEWLLRRAKGGGAFKHGVEVSNPMWSGDEDSDEDDVSGARPRPLR